MGSVIVFCLAPRSLAVTMWTEFAGFGRSPSRSARAPPAAGTALARYRQGRRGFLRCSAPRLSRLHGGKRRLDPDEDTDGRSRKAPGPCRLLNEASAGQVAATTTPCPNKACEACPPRSRAV